jgi:transposase InsO family protein
MDILGKLHEAKLFSTVDLKDGFYQMKLDPDSHRYTAFVTPEGLLYEFTRVPMGIKCAPSLMCRLVAMLTADSKSRVAYIDDIMIMTKDFETMMAELEALFRKLREHGLRITLRKCAFARREVDYLGFVVSAQGIKPAAKLVEKIQNHPVPTVLKALQRFLGMANFYRAHIQNYSEVAAPLLAVVRHANKSRKFEWNSKAQQAFEKLKSLLTTDIILIHPDPKQQFILHTDASDIAIGATLSQADDRGKLKPVAFISKTLSATEQRYSVIERETLAIYWAVKKLHVFLYANPLPFIIFTDHQPLKAIFTEKHPESRRLLKWVLHLQDYNYEIKYITGHANAVADCLSRLAPNNTIHAIPATEELKEAIAEEPILEAVQNILTNQRPPALPRKQQRFVTHHISEFFIRHDTLFHEDNKGQVQLVLPMPYRKAILTNLHNTPLAGHLGIQKTINRISKFYYWPGMIKDIKRHVNECEACNRAKPAPHMQTEAKAVKFQEAFETIAIDLVGPLPATPQLEQEFKYLLTAQCCLTKFLFAIPVTQITSKVICDTLFRRIFAIAGFPARIITDNGPQFTSQEFREYMDTLGIQITYTSVYTPSSNPVERAHRTLKQTLTTFVNEQPQLWYEYLPSVLLSLNTAMHNSIRDSPFYLFFGRDFLPPSEKVLQQQVTGIMENPQPHNILASAIITAREIARHFLQQNAEKRAQATNDKTKPYSLKAGDRCYLDVTPTRQHKFANPFEGPMRVIKILSPQNAAIQRINRPFEAPQIVRISRLKPQPQITECNAEIALPQYTTASTQTHADHKLQAPANAGTQTPETAEEAKEMEPATKRRGRPRKAAPDMAALCEHKHWLRSKAAPK